MNEWVGKVKYCILSKLDRIYTRYRYNQEMLDGIYTGLYNITRDSNVLSNLLKISDFNQLELYIIC